MLPTTKDAIRAMLKADASLTPENRLEILSAMDAAGSGSPSNRTALKDDAKVVRRKDVAQMFGRSVRFVDMLAQSNELRRVKLPGRTRACGFRLADVIALIK